jgi:hypothetical protein
MDLAMIQLFIDEINECQKKNGSTFELPDINSPGISNFLASALLVIDTALVTAFKPIAELKKILTDYVIPAIANPKKVADLMKKLAEFMASIADMVKNPISFIVNEILKPLQNLLIPVALDLSMLVPGLMVKLEKGFASLPKGVVDQINKMISPEWIEKIPKFILIPIHIMVGLFVKVIEKIVDAVSSPLTKIAKIVTDFTVNFVKSVNDIISAVLLTAIEPVLAMIVPGGIDMASVTAAFSSIFADVFSGKVPDIKGYQKQAPDLGKVWGFLSIIVCFIKTVLKFIVTFPKLFFG